MLAGLTLAAPQAFKQLAPGWAVTSCIRIGPTRKIRRRWIIAHFDIAIADPFLPCVQEWIRYLQRISASIRGNMKRRLVRITGNTIGLSPVPIPLCSPVRFIHHPARLFSCSDNACGRNKLRKSDDGNFDLVNLLASFCKGQTSQQYSQQTAEICH